MPLLAQKEKSTKTPMSTDTEKNEGNSPSKYQFYPTFFLGLFLGVFGAHRFYTGKIKTGIVQLLTFGGLGLWWFVDMVMILFGKFKGKDGVSIKNINPKLAWSVFVIVCLVGLGSGGEDSARGTSTGGSTDLSLTPVNADVYLCMSPSSILRLSSDGSAALTIEGSVSEGIWRKIDSGIEFKGNTSAAIIFTSDGLGGLVAVKYGYRFEKLSK